MTPALTKPAEASVSGGSCASLCLKKIFFAAEAEQNKSGNHQCKLKERIADAQRECRRIGGDGGKLFLCGLRVQYRLIALTLRQDKRHNAEQQIEQRVHQIGNRDFSGAQIEISEYETAQKRIEELVQIRVEEGEQ